MPKKKTVNFPLKPDVPLIEQLVNGCAQFDLKFSKGLISAFPSRCFISPDIPDIDLVRLVADRMLKTKNTDCNVFGLVLQYGDFHGGQHLLTIIFDELLDPDMVRFEE